MEQPAGITEGSLTLRRPSTTTTEWWQCSRHRIGNRIRFWIKVYRSTTAQSMELLSEYQTDDLWGPDVAHSWIQNQTQSRIRSGFSVVSHEGETGLLGFSTDTIPGKDTE